jgi:hypothetical protein
MKNKVARRFISVLFVLIVLTASFLLYSSLIDWSLFSIILFWFFIVPPLSHYSARLFTRTNENLSPAINGCLLFYSLIGLLVYTNIESSDYLRLILMSIIPAMVIINLFNINEVGTHSK